MSSADAAVNTALEARKAAMEAALARAKEAGWTDRMAFEHPTVTGAETDEPDTRGDPSWLSDATVYEFNDDEGDVGPPNPELEKMLFGTENGQSAGGAIEALAFDVTVESTNKIHPVRNVCSANSFPCLHCMLTL